MATRAIIRNYGLLWERTHVQWGKPGPGNAGKLLGYERTPKTVVDFSEQAGIYVLYQGADPANHEVVYVGQAGGGKQGKGLYDRLWDHTRDHLWNRWNRFSWFGTYAVGKKGTLVHTKATKTIHPSVAGALDDVEGVLLALFEPRLNAQGPRWQDATEFTQFTGLHYDPGDPLRKSQTDSSTSRGA